MTGSVQLAPASQTDRDDAAAFAGRVARWEQLTAVTLTDEAGLVRMWAPTPFDALAGRAIGGRITPSGAQVAAGNLLAELAVGSDAVIQLTTIGGPAAELPGPDIVWHLHEQVPAAALAEVSRKGTDMAKQAGGPPAALLDSPALTVIDDTNGRQIKIPMRMLFALSGMGFAPTGSVIQVRSASGWIRLDATFGSILRRNRIALPVFV